MTYPSPMQTHSEVWPVSVRAYQTPFEGLPTMRNPAMQGFSGSTGVSMGIFNRRRRQKRRSEMQNLPQSKRRSLRRARRQRTADDISYYSSRAAEATSAGRSILEDVGLVRRRRQQRGGDAMLPPPQQSGIPDWLPWAGGAAALAGIAYLAMKES